jgi:hypothetical protein
MARRRPQPYQQGQLDGLCGLYATINAIRLALGERGDQFSKQDWQELFGALLVGVDETVGAAAVVSSGIATRPLARLLRLAVRHMADEHEIDLAISHPFSLQERASVREVVGRLADLSREPHTAVLLSFAGHLSHWSVLKKVGRRSLKLFDSSGHARVRIATCRMSYERHLIGTRENVIHPSALFRIALTCTQQAPVGSASLRQRPGRCVLKCIGRCSERPGHRT